MVESRTIRYAEFEGKFTLWDYAHDEESRYGSTGPVVTTGTLDKRPEWLVRIVNVALTGGHVARPASPPPDMMFWCDIDPDHNLIDFTVF